MESEQLAWKIRRHGVEMTHLSGGSHIGAVLSVADIIAVLYTDVMNYDSKNPDWSETQVDELLKKYSEGNSSPSDFEAKKESKSESSLKENQEEKRNASSIPEAQLELDKELIGKNTRGIRSFWRKRS